MADMAEASVDAIVTDPPYDLTAGKKGGSGPASATSRTPQGRSRIGAGFMGRVWDATGVAFDPETWQQALRVLKPGGHLLAFGSPRTYHRLAVAIEDAGFELTYSITWVYGEGMPKSHDVAAALDKLAGHPSRGRAIPVASHAFPNGRPLSANPVGPYEPRTEEARRWAGWGTGLKPAHEIVVTARKPFPCSVARNVLAYGTGALNIDGCRVAGGKEVPGSPSDPSNRQIYGGFSRSDPATTTGWDPKVGRWPANVVLAHSPSCRQVGERVADGYAINRFTDGAKPFGGGAGHPYESTLVPSQAVPVFDCAPGCPVTELDRQSGQSVSRVGKPRSASPGTGWGMSHTGAEYDDEGGASRYFNAFAWDPELDLIAYYPKASTDEREAGLDERFQLDEAGRHNHHPTVKPLALMRHLVRLVTPPGGVVLDPFAGSGTTGMACGFEGFGFLGMEQETAYVELAQARVAHAEDLVAKGYVRLPARDGQADAKPEQMSLL